MKKKISIILLLFTIFLCSITYVDEVWGDGSDYVSGTSAAVATCEEGQYCFTGAVGFRMTLVNNETGERCKYDPKTNTICSSSGKITSTNDYWFETDDLAFTEKGEINYKRSCYSYSTKLTKFEFLNKLPTSGIYETDITNDCTRAEKQFTELGFPSVNSDKYTQEWTTSDEKIEVSRVPKNMELVEEYLLCTLGGIDEKGNNINCLSRNGQPIKKDYTIINKIFTELTGSEIDITTINGLDNVSIQFDQLLQIGNYSLNSANTNQLHTVLVTKGTVAEASYLYMKMGSGTANSVHFGCITHNSDGFTNTQNEDCTSSMVGGGYFTGFYADSSSSYSGKKIQTPSTNSPVIDLSGYTYIHASKYTLYDIPLSKFLEWDTSNVFKFWINPDIAGNCNDNARKILKSAGITSFNKTGKPSTSIDYNYLQNKFKADKKISEQCYDDEGKLKKDCYQLSEDYLKNVGVVPESYSNVDLCKPSNCSSTVENQINQSFEIANKKDIEIFPSGYEEIIKFLYGNVFTKDGGLEPVIWQFFREAATCNKTIPSCPTTSVAKCTSGPGEKEIIFKDSNDTVDCIQQGIAYNNLFNASDGVPNVIESSKDKHYSSKGFGDVYCTEEVKFIVPNGGQTAVAGTVFKWGTIIDKESNVFGKMIVTRKCYLSETFRDEKTKTFDSYWVWDNSINPTITIKYKQATNHDLDLTEVNTNLGIRLREYDMYTNDDGLVDKNYMKFKPDGTLDKTDIMKKYPDINSEEDITEDEYTHGEGKPNNPKTITCGLNLRGENTCANIQFITTTATYDIIYNDNLKWYSDKSLNGELIVDSGESQPSYTFAGYGLPTSFPNPHNEICSQWNDPTPSEDFNKVNGDLKLYVNNVGTNGHFNDLISSKDLFEDDDDADNNEINYYCDYKIKNKLFDNEYALKEEYVCDPNRTPKGIDVVFRTVDLISSKDDLSKAFPGRSGLGYKEGEVGTRTMGANWDKFSDESIADLLGEDIYSREPMYEITLDSPTIQTIRKWNNEAREKDIDPYTDMSSVDNSSNVHEGNTGYYYSKTDETDETVTVRSMFLTKLYEEFSGNEKFKSRCISTISDDGGYTRIVNCNQSWWLDDPDERNKISMELRTPIGG